MTCAQVERAEIIERYLTDRLSSQEQEAFEEHYFTCSRCFESLETLRALQERLREAAPAIRAASLPRMLPWRWGWAAGVAALAGVAVWVVWGRSPSHEPTPPPTVTSAPIPSGLTFAELARVEPPPYSPIALRGAADRSTQRFQAGMRRYIERNFAGAIPDLQAAATLDPTAPEIQFFLAICYLLTEQTDEAIVHLLSTIALGDTPYLEEAHFYLAKAHLRQGNDQSAEEELQSTIRLEGDLENQASELLRQLERVRATARDPGEQRKTGQPDM